MMRKTVLLLATWMVVWMAATSCVDKFGLGNWWGGGDGYTVSLKVGLQNQVTISRADRLFSFDENRVFDIYLLIFGNERDDSHSKLISVHYQDLSTDAAATDDIDDENHEFRITGLKVNPGTYRVYAIANLRYPAMAYEESAHAFADELDRYKSVLENPHNNQSVNFTVKALKEKALSAVSTERTPVSGQPGGCIMMGTMHDNTEDPDGLGLCNFSNAGGQVAGAVYLSRIDARISFDVQVAQGATFTLTNYSVIQVPKYTTVYGDTKDRDRDNRRPDFLTVTGSNANPASYHGTTLSRAPEWQTNEIPANSNNGKDLRDFFTHTLISQDVDKIEDNHYRFTFYMPENRNQPNAQERVENFNQRDLRKKENRLNALFSFEDDQDDVLAGTPLYDRYARKRLWEKANMYSTYVILEGEYSGPVTQSDLERLTRDQEGNTNPNIRTWMGDRDRLHVTAHVQYMIHLGNCGTDVTDPTRLNDFHVERNTNYTYRIKVLGVHNIYIEAKTESLENQSGAQGTIIAEKGAQSFLLDSHNETLLLHFTKDQFLHNVHRLDEMKDFIAYRTYTPFNDLYSRANLSIDPTTDPANAAWLRFALCRQEGGHYIPDLMSYSKPTELLSIDDLIIAIRECLKYQQRNVPPGNDNGYIEGLNPEFTPALDRDRTIFDENGDLYVTCFINENFYDERDTNLDGKETKGSDDALSNQSNEFYKTHDSYDTEEKLYAYRMTVEKERYQEFLAVSTRKIPYSLIPHDNLFRNVYWKYYVNTPPRAFYLLTYASTSSDLRSRVIEPEFIVQQRAIQSPYTNSQLYDQYSPFVNGQQLPPLERAFGVEVVDETEYLWLDEEWRNAGYELNRDRSRVSPSRLRYARGGYTANRYQLFDFVTQSSGEATKDEENWLANSKVSDGYFNTVDSRYGIWQKFLDGHVCWSDIINDRMNGYRSTDEVNRGHGYSGLRADYEPTDKINYTGPASGKTTYPNHGMQYMVFGCMQRNRDVNRNGTIQRNEMQWYLPSMGQLLGVELARNVYSDHAAFLLREGKDYDNNGSMGTIPSLDPTFAPSGYAAGSNRWRIYYVSSYYRVPWLWAGEMFHLDRYLLNEDGVHKRTNDVGENPVSSYRFERFRYRCARNLGRVKTTTDASDYAGPQSFITKGESNGHIVLTSAYMPSTVHVTQPNTRGDAGQKIGASQFEVSRFYKNLMLANIYIKAPVGDLLRGRAVVLSGTDKRRIENRTNSYAVNGILIRPDQTICELLNQPQYWLNGRETDNPLHEMEGKYTNWRAPQASEMAQMMYVGELPISSNPNLLANRRKQFDVIQNGNHSDPQNTNLTNAMRNNRYAIPETITSIYNGENLTTVTTIDEYLWLGNSNTVVGWSRSEEKMSRAYGRTIVRCVRDVTDFELQRGH